MPKKENRKGQKGIRIRNKVIVNVNTGKRTGNTRQAPRQPPPTGAFPKVMLLNPQPQIQPQNQLEPNTQSRLQQALEKQLELQNEASSQQIQNLQNIITGQARAIEEMDRKRAQEIVNRSKGQQNRYTPQPGYEKSAEASSSSSGSSPTDKRGRERQRESTMDVMERIIREPTIPPVII